MKLSIIIVSWNVQKYLKQCLESLFKYYDFNYEVIVVDNASVDETVNMIKRDWPQVKLIANQTNNGFARANNQGATIAKGEYLLFLNPDTEFIDSQSLLSALNYLSNQLKVELLGWQVLNTDHTNQVAVRRFPSLYSQIITLLKLNNIFPALNRHYHAHDFDYQQTQTVDSILGACMLMRTKDFISLGKFNENYYIWFEEVDLCRQVWDKGQKVMYYNKAQIVHHGGQSFTQMLSRGRQKIFNHSLLTYWRLHQPRWQLYILYLFIPLNCLLTYLQDILKIKKNDYQATK